MLVLFYLKNIFKNWYDNDYDWCHINNIINNFFYHHTNSTLSSIYPNAEYGLGRSASPKGDVYSFGVLLLEIVMGRRPTEVLIDEGSSLHEWVKSHFPHKLDPIVAGA